MRKLQKKNVFYGKNYLCDYPLRFYRQRIIVSYIVDFYCHQAKLVIELDGSQHYLEENRQKEEERSQYLTSLGLFILRFSNLDILQNLAGVCEEIDRVVTERVNPLVPSSKGGTVR